MTDCLVKLIHSQSRLDLWPKLIFQTIIITLHQTNPQIPAKGQPSDILHYVLCGFVSCEKVCFPEMSDNIATGPLWPPVGIVFITIKKSLLFTVEVSMPISEIWLTIVTSLQESVCVCANVCLCVRAHERVWIDGERFSFSFCLSRLFFFCCCVYID